MTTSRMMPDESATVDFAAGRRSAEAFDRGGIWANGLVERRTNYTDLDEARTAAERLAEERG